MSEIIFIYKDNQIPISFAPNEKIRALIEKFCVKASINKENYSFRFNKNIIDEVSNIESLLIKDTIYQSQ